MFGSRTIAQHLMRGGLAVALIAAALRFGSSEPLVGVAAVAAAIVAMRGCPLCWTIGLIETVGARLRGLG